MNTNTIALCIITIIAWWLVGYFGLKTSWRTKFDFTNKERTGFCVIGLILGPIAVIILAVNLWLAFSKERVIEKKRFPAELNLLFPAELLLGSQKSLF